MQLSDKVKQKLQNLPDKPGVYIMRDRNGRVIYIGKAASLKSRVRSYFQQGTLRSANPKLRGLIRSIEDFDYLVVRTEAEATLTEGRFIKEYRPRYNVFFKDDKRFLLLKVDMSEPFPRFATARIRKSDSATYFGPYASAGSARATLDFVEKRFGIRQCKPRVPGDQDYKHCSNDIIRFCSAPCVGKISEEDYKRRVEEAGAFLRGERPGDLKELEEDMEREAQEMNFEKAAALRDTLFALRTAIKEKAKGTKSLEMKVEDARRGVAELKAVLDLESEPRVIEAYDISNISGTLAVGSMVCSVDGVPNKTRYRLFRIKTVEGPDDPGMMAEVIRRRFARVVKEGSALPDLVLVDGGITQLRAARGELALLGLSHLPAAGLAKRYEEIYWEQKGPREPIRLPADSNALKILQHLRDEAHRFALTYHRRLRSKKIRESALDDVPGIGKKRKELLLQHFGSVDRLRRASVEEITAVPGIGQAMAAEIHRVVMDR